MSFFPTASNSGVEPELYRVFNSNIFCSAAQCAIRISAISLLNSTIALRRSRGKSVLFWPTSNPLSKSNLTIGKLLRKTAWSRKWFPFEFRPWVSAPASSNNFTVSGFSFLMANSSGHTPLLFFIFSKYFLFPSCWTADSPVNLIRTSGISSNSIIAEDEAPLAKWNRLLNVLSWMRKFDTFSIKIFTNSTFSDMAAAKIASFNPFSEKENSLISKIFFTTCALPSSQQIMRNLSELFIPMNFGNILFFWQNKIFSRESLFFKNSFKIGESTTYWWKFTHDTRLGTRWKSILFFAASVKLLVFSCFGSWFFIIFRTCSMGRWRNAYSMSAFAFLWPFSGLKYPLIVEDGESMGWCDMYLPSPVMDISCVA